MTEQHKQRLSLTDRKILDLNGVSGVISFDAETVRLATLLGDLIIRGEGLNISSLIIEKGEVQVQGKVDAINYYESGAVQKGTKKALKRLLK